MKVNPKVAVPLSLVAAGIGYGIYYYCSVGEKKKDIQISHHGIQAEREEGESSGGGDDGTGGSSPRGHYRVPGSKTVPNRVNGEEPLKENNIETPNDEVNEGEVSKGNSSPENATLEIKEIPLEIPPGEEKYANEEIESETNLSGFRIVKGSGIFISYPDQFKSLLRQYLVKPSPELLDKMEKVEKEAILLRPFVPRGLSQDASIDEIIAHFNKSPWKRLAIYENDVMPDEELLEMMEKITPVELRDLPLPDYLISKLSSDDSKKKFIWAIRKIKELEKEPENTPIASAFAMCGNLPKEARQRLNALLDKNWTRRARAAVDLRKRDVDEFDKNFHGPSLANQVEFEHLMGMIMRRTKDTKTFITKAEFFDIYTAFKTLDGSGINYKEYDASSSKAFILSVFETMYNDNWKRDLQGIWSENKDDRPSLLKKHKAYARRLHGVFKNFNTLLPKGRKEFMEYFARIVRVEMEKFLDFSFVRAWKGVRKNKVDKEQRDAIKEAFNEYVNCAGYYGLTSIKTDDPMKLLKERLFQQPIKGDLLATNPPRVVEMEGNGMKRFSQCNATLAPIFRSAVINPKGTYARMLLETLDILTKNDPTPVTSLPNFYYHDDRNSTSRLLEEGSMRLQNVALFFDENQGELQPFFQVDASKGKIHTCPSFVGNVLISTMQTNEVPMTTLVEDFETGDPVIFALAAFSENHNTYVKRNKNDWYQITETSVKKIFEEDIRKLDYSKEFIIAYFYRQKQTTLS